jgi:hypothetical protein
VGPPVRKAHKTIDLLRQKLLESLNAHRELPGLSRQLDQARNRIGLLESQLLALPMTPRTSMVALMDLSTPTMLCLRGAGARGWSGEWLSEGPSR